MLTVRPDLRDYLRQHAAAISRHWSVLGNGFNGHRYLARRLDGADLSRADPFKLLAQGIKDARGNMGQWSLAVVGMIYPEQRPGFVLLADRSNAATGDRGHSEELLDQSCALARAL